MYLGDYLINTLNITHDFKPLLIIHKKAVASCLYLFVSE